MVVPNQERSDETLAALAAAGDYLAFEEILERYQRRVFRLLCRLTSETDAPDLLQETFLQMHRHLASFRSESLFSTWLYRIATNTALMHRRANARRPTESLEAFLPQFDAQGIHADTPAHLQVTTRVEEMFDRQRLADKARAGIAALPDLYKEAFVLRDLEEMSTAEVAQVLNVEPATVRQRVHRARLMLRGYLNHLVEEEP